MKKQLTKLLFFTSTIFATIIHVPADSTTIQSGINGANNEDTVLVHPGTYFENINFNGKNITVSSTMGADSTIIDGNQNGSVVTFNGGEDTTAVLMGFTLTNGNNLKGGGIYCNNSSPKITHVNIMENTAKEDGGGIYCYYNSNPIIRHVTIAGNSCFYEGGGIHCQSNSNPILTDVIIRENVVGLIGGGMYSIISNPTLINVTISNNYSNKGGGLYFISSNLIFENVNIIGNSAHYYGGGIYCSNSNPEFSHVTIADNSTTYLDNTSLPLGGAGIIFSGDSHVSLEHVTITGNIAAGDSADGGGILNASSELELVNCILWNNIPVEITILSGSVSVYYSDIQGDWAGGGNIDSDPKFCNPDSSDYTLAENSPCIGTGYNGVNMGHQDLGCDALKITPGNGLPDTFILHQNYPNPFNPTTTLHYELPDNTFIKISIFDILGMHVKTLVNQKQSAGYKSVIWNGRNDVGNPVSAGVYLYSIHSENFNQTKKMVLLK